MTTQENLLEQRRSFLQEVKSSYQRNHLDLIHRVLEFVSQKLGPELPCGLGPARILLHQHAEPSVVSAGLLTPVLRRGAASHKELRDRFGEGVVQLVEGLHHLASSDERPPETRALRNALVEDLRVLVLLLAFRLHELLRTMEWDCPRARQMARETLDIYAPLADLMGMASLRRQLEDLSFRILEPEAHASLWRAVKPILKEDQACLQILVEGLQGLLRQSGIEGSIHGRIKSLYSIHRKMQRKGTSLEEILDRIGLRVLVPTVADCYSVLGVLHTHFRPIPGTFDDYIGLPKVNGYQSLHTCVYPVRQVSRKPVEFQIRTHWMHLHAEYGYAAHWRYKEVHGRTGEEGEGWLSRLSHLGTEDGEEEGPDRFVQRLRRELMQPRIVIFGGDGSICRLPQGATVRDFLERQGVSPDQVSVVIVNGIPRPMDHPLSDGDAVELPSKAPVPGTTLEPASEPGSSQADPRPEPYPPNLGLKTEDCHVAR
jgi:GTP pyrophosphokinase